MKLLNRYIAGAVIKLTLLVLVAVVGMEFFISVVDEFGDVGSGHYGLLQALLYALLTLPSNLYQLFPMVGLLGALLALGNLATSSELIVMRASGMTVFKIISAVLFAALIMLLVVTAIGEGVAPEAQSYANNMKLISESNGQVVQTTQGVWFKHNNNFIHVWQIIDSEHLKDVIVYQFDSHQQLTDIVQSKRVDFQNGHWLMRDGVVTQLSTDHVLSAPFITKNWPINLDAHLFHVSKDVSGEMNLWELISYVHYRTLNGMTTSSFSLSMWQRLFQPLATLIMIFLAIPFIFGPLRTVTMGVRIVTGAVAGFAFYLLNQFFGPFSLVYQIPPVLGASLPILFFALLAVVLMRKVK